MPPAWATRARQPPQEEGEDPVTVLVTGFGPFLTRFPRNSSWEIASTLPALLPPTATSPTPIHIYVHHAPVRVAYNSVNSLVPVLLPPNSHMHPPPDIILHIGLAAGRDFYTLEKGAHGRGYGAIPDVDEHKFGDEEGDERWPADKFPLKLETGFETEDVLGRWKEELGHCSSPSHVQASKKRPDVRISPDAGNYLCGFLYYNSLAHYYSLDPSNRPVAFLHVPDLSASKEKLDTGREVTITLIKALVESRRKVG
ncbi:pyroglutamyl peptidase-like protein type I, partial [Melanomma pulvis-pyrius CBS 109.77]